MFQQKIIKPIFDCLFPIECLGCGKEDILICNDCLVGISLKTDFPCVVCGRPTIFGKTHRECLTKTAIDGALCATSFKDKFIKELIHAYKYKYVKDLGRYLAWVMARYVKRLQSRVLPKSILKEGINIKQLIVMRMTPGFLRYDHKITKTPQNFGANKPILVPIPLHLRRLRERGFNQAEVLARELGKYFDWEIETEILRRVRYTRAQMSQKTQERRMKNIKDAFEISAKLRKECETTKMRNAELSNNLQIKNRTIILIDDVLTTGATTNEAAKVLKAAGAKEVWVMCVAKD